MNFELIFELFDGSTIVGKTSNELIYACYGTNTPVYNNIQL